MNQTYIPSHIAIIPDGNGRWAKRKGMPRTYGHKVGSEVFRRVIRYASSIGVKYLSFYAFSTENWRRSEEEVGGLMTLLGNYLVSSRKELDELNVRMIFSGRRDEFSPDFLAKIDNIVKYSSSNTGMVCNIALNYGGRDEIVHSVKEIARKVATGEITPDQIDENMISNNLFNPDIPDPDLIVRTSGELRTSNFLLWESAYSELYFTDVLWPDFKDEDLDKAIDEYNRRHRRFGGV